MTGPEIQRYFKIMGKVIAYAQRAAADSDAHRKILAGTVDQSTTGLASDADTVVKFVTPAIQNMNTTVTSLDAVKANAKTLGTTLLQQVIGVELGLKANAKLAEVGSKFVAEMNAADETVAPSGVNGANDDGFAVYFASNFNITLPQDQAPTIPDAWIDDDVI